MFYNRQKECFFVKRFIFSLYLPRIKMCMHKSSFFVALTTITYLLYVFFQFMGNDMAATYSSSLIFPSVALIYFIYAKRKNLYFSLFLILFSASELLDLVEDYMSYEVYYYLGNVLYILAFLCLLIKVAKLISFKVLFKNFKLHLIVLGLLNVYIMYVLKRIIVDPYVVSTGEFLVEHSYNLVLLLLLSASLINYLYSENKKSLFIFLGSLCLVFSEVLFVAYSYISEMDALGFMSTTLALIAIYFYFQQAKLSNEISDHFKASLKT